METEHQNAQRRRQNVTMFDSTPLYHLRVPIAHLRARTLAEKLRLMARGELVRDGIFSAVLNLVNTVFGFALVLVLARLLGAEGYGIYSLAVALVLLMSIPAQAGFPPLVVRETARGMAEGKPELVRAVWRWSGRYAAIASLLAAAVIGPFLVWRLGGLATSMGRTVGWALLLVPLMTLNGLPGAALQGLRQIARGQLPELVLAPGLLLALVGGTAMLTPVSITPERTMSLRVVSTAFALIVGSWLLLRSTPQAIRAADLVASQRPWLRSAATFGLLAGFNLVLGQTDVVILGMFETPDQVGIYRVAFQVANLAAFGLIVLNVALGPRFAALHASGALQEMQRLAVVGARAVTIVNVILTIIFLVAGRTFFTRVFGSEFGGSYQPLMILLVGQVVNSAVGSVGLLLNMTGHERRTARIVATAAVINVVLNVVLVPRWGALGAAAATSAVMVMWNFLMWRRVRLDLGINTLAFAGVGRGGRRL